jgi:stringent starvation protein B
MEFVRNGEIVLNISFGATSGLKMDNEAVTFKARFGGVSREIYVPVANVMAIYASEMVRNGIRAGFDGNGRRAEPESLAEENDISENEAPPRKLGLAAVSSRPDGEEKADLSTEQKNLKKSEKPR